MADNKPTQKKTAIDRNKDTTILCDTFYPTVAKNLADTNKAKKFFRYALEYRNRNIDILTNPLITNYLIFQRDGEDANIIFRTCGIDRKELNAKIHEVRKLLVLDKVASADSDSFDISVALIFMMKYYRKDTPKLKIVQMYYMYSIYHLVYKKYFNTFKANEEVMQYTMDHMSQKFDIVKLGSLEKALESKMISIQYWMDDKMDPLTDMNIIEIINSIRTRLNDMIKKIRQQYDINYKQGNRVFTTKERNSEGEYMYDNESNLGAVYQLSSAYTTKFYSGVDAKICHNAAKMCGVSENELRATIEYIMRDSDTRLVSEFYDAIFYAFFQQYPSASTKDVKSVKFVAAADSLYKKGNSNDKNIIRIKELSHVWLDKGSNTYRVTTRAATQNNFRKALYLYFCWLCASNE